MKSHRVWLAPIFAVVFSGIVAQTASAESIFAGPNTDMICAGKDFKKCDPGSTKQNEPSCAVSTRNPNTIFCGVNDYRNVQWMRALTGVDGQPFLSWLGSFDGGTTFQGGLIPGCPEPDPFCDGAPAIKGMPQASDPTIASGPFGVFAYTGIANNSATNTGVVFAGIWVDDNNPSKINQNTLRHVRTVALDINTGGTGQFQDKPWSHIDIFRANDPGSIFIPGKGNVPDQTLPFGRIYAVWSTFVGSSNSSQIKISSSIDGGATWGNPTKLSAGGLVQGSIIVVDPLSGTVAIFWRQFKTSSQPNAIMGSISTNKGKSFSKEFVVALIDPFDQGTNLAGVVSPTFSPLNPPAIRVTTFPTAAVSVDYGSAGGTLAPATPPVSRIHVAWAERKGPFSTINGVPTTQRDSRIVMSTIRLDASGNLVGTWSTPIPVDTPSPTSYNPGGLDAFGRLSAHGHQFFPAMKPTSVGGRVSIVYHDLHDDSTQGQLQCPGGITSCKLSDRIEVRVPVGDLPACPEKVYTSYLADGVPVGLASSCSTKLLKKHYGETRLSLFAPSDTPTMSSARLSQFTFGSPTSEGTVTPRQSTYEPYNNLLFATDASGISHAAFHGDYTALAGAPLFVPNPSPTSASDLWVYNINPVYTNAISDSPIKNIANNAVVDYAAWTSNRLLQLPPRTLACTLSPTVDGIVGTKNQETFMARATNGPFLTTGRTASPLDGALRALTVNVHNPTNNPKTVQLKVLPPVHPVTKLPVATATASFLRENSSQTVLCATVERRSTLSRTIFATSPKVFIGATPVNAQVVVQVQEGNFTAGDGLCTRGFNATSGFSSFVVFNPDPYNAGSTSDLLPEVTSLGTGDHVVTNVDPLNDNNTSPLTLTAFTSEDFTNLAFGSEDFTNEDFINEDFINEDFINEDFTNEDFINEDFINEDFINEDFTNEDFINGAVQDVTTQVTNSGSTDVTSNIKLLKKLTNLCTSSGGPLKCQLLVHSLSVKPVAKSCTIKQSKKSVLRTNIRNPKFEDFTNTNIVDTLQTVQVQNSDSNNVILTLKPKETLKVTLRLIDRDKTHFCALPGAPPPPNCIDLRNDAKPVPATQSASAGTKVTPLIIIGLTEPTGTIGQAYSSAGQVIGALPGTTWCVSSDGVICAANPSALLPPSLSLDASSGTISGTPTNRVTTSGFFPFTLIATGPSTNPQVDKQGTSITINKAPTTISISPSPSSSVVGQPVTVNLTVLPTLSGTPYTGTATLTSNDGTIFTCTPLSAAGASSCSGTFATAGTKTLTAAYSGDNNFLGSSASASYSVAKANTTITVSDTPDPSIVNGPVTVSFVITANPPYSPLPAFTGTVSVSGFGSSCTATLPATNCALTPTTVGSGNITATYNGDSNFNSSPPGTASHTVVYNFIGTSFADGGYWGSKNMGAAVPFAWELTDFNGAVISDMTSLVLMTAVFNGAAPANGICNPSTASLIPPATLFSAPNGSTGQSSFRFQPPNFLFNWDTSVRPIDPATNALTGIGCYTVNLQLKDATVKQTGVRLF
jgi:hypothetical protein